MDSDLIRDRRFNRVALGITLVIIVYLTINIFRIGGDSLVASINNYVTPPFAVINTIVCFWIWTRSKQDDIARRIWGLFTLGIVFWTLAEFLWIVYSTGLIEEPPYPSTADIFFLIGYLPLFISLLTRYRTFQIQATRRQWTTVGLVAIPSILAIGYLIILPIIRDYSPDRIVESILNIVYPLLDLFLLLIALFIIINYSKGRFSFAWRMITLGLILTSFGDLVFYYASWNELYYPEGQVNWISVLTDVPYNISYLVISFGVFVYWLTIIRQKDEAVQIEFPSPRLINCDILLFTNEQHRIISFSDNFPRLIKAFNKDRLFGKPLGDVLGLTGQVTDALIRKILELGYINEMQLVITDLEGRSHKTWVTCVAVNYGSNEYHGANFVIRAYVENKIENDLDDESRMMVQDMLSKAGVIDRENREILKSYFSTEMNILHNLIHKLGGENASRALERKLHDTVVQNEWSIGLEFPEISLLDNYENTQLAKIFVTLLEQAKEYARDVVDSPIVDAEMARVEREINERDRKILSGFGLIDWK